MKRSRWRKFPTLISKKSNPPPKVVVTLQKHNGGRVFYDSRVNDIQSEKISVDGIEGRAETHRLNQLASIQQAYEDYTIIHFGKESINFEQSIDSEGNPHTGETLKQARTKETESAVGEGKSLLRAMISV